jgi:metal-responsive CopG/Arc/MetJ family transcriptional regulator
MTATEDLRSQTVSASLTKAKADRFAKIAKSQYLSKSSLIAKILDEYLDKIDNSQNHG